MQSVSNFHKNYSVFFLQVFKEKLQNFYKTGDIIVVMVNIFLDF